jgi:hypothetical protein
MQSKDKPGKEVSKLMESLKKGATWATTATGPGPVGPEQLLKAVKYVKQSSNCDGNCFYNSIGMLSSNYMIMEEEYKKYLGMNQYDIQFQEQTRVRRELSTFLTKIYELIEGKVDVTTREYKNSPILKYIIKNGNKENSAKGFKYIRKISKWVGYKYYGSDEEIYFASLFYLQPIITVIGISDITVFNIFDWNTYFIKDKSGNQVSFKDYIEKDKDEINVQGVIDFLINQNRQYSYDTTQTSNFLLNHPSSYFLVGGRGHWVYAVNESLLKKDGAGASASAGAGAVVDAAPRSGGNASYNVRTTKKIKNKYYKKESSSSKTTKKHKKTRRMNKNKKRIKKTIKI